jgi:hypothetical protein
LGVLKVTKGSIAVSFLIARLGAIALAAVLLCDSAQAEAQQFSAEIVATKDGGAAASAGKLYVSRGKARIEAAALADGFFVIDGAAPSAYFVRPSARQFMDARQSSLLTRIFVPVDPENPCSAWQAMASLADATDHDAWRCERVGQETIDGSSAIAYQAISTSGDKLLGWIDPMRKFPLRIKTEDGTVFELGDLRDAPQPAQLFEIPRNFTKFDPQALIDRIKQSDVWVEKPGQQAQP